jgi:hypothetical protein
MEIFNRGHHVVGASRAMLQWQLFNKHVDPRARSVDADTRQNEEL